VSPLFKCLEFLFNQLLLLTCTYVDERPKPNESKPAPPEKPAISENTTSNSKIEVVLEEPKRPMTVASPAYESAPKSTMPVVDRDAKKKKKGLFGGLFGKKNKKGGRRGGKEDFAADGSI
jgi:hypothetical protein